MAKTSLVGGTTSYIATVFIQDSTSTTGAGKTGLAFNTASLTAYYVRPGAAAVAITLATQTTTGAFSSGGFVEIDATNMPGVYRFDVPNAVLAAGVKSAAILLKGATGMAPLALEFEITATDNQDATAAGISRIDAAISSRSTYAGGAVASVTGNVGGSVVGDVQGKVLGGGASALSGVGVQADVEQWKGSTAPANTGDAFARLGPPAGASVSADIAAVKTDTGTLTSRIPGTVQPQTGDAYARLGAPAGASISADIAGVAAGVWAVGTRTLTSFGTLVSDIATAVWGAATRTLTAFGFTAGLTAQQVANAVWDEPTASHQTAGSTGKALTSASAPTAAQVATAVWDEPTASHQTAGSTGKALTSASSAGDPWATQLPGSYVAGTAGRIVGGTPNTYAQQGAGDTPFVGR